MRILATLTIVLACQTAMAEYCQLPDSEATVISNQNSAGRWFGCGPVQCLLTGYQTQEEVFDLLHNDDNAPRYVCSVVIRGRNVHVYTLGRTLESYETNAQRRYKGNYLN